MTALKPTPTELAEAVRLHGLWIAGDHAGKRLDLEGANLEGANLAGANLDGANLDGANLDESTGLIYAQCSWSDHGQIGRKLLAVHSGGVTTCYCGCLTGSPDDLRRYIAKNEPEFAQSRTIAADFVLARIDEMIETRKGSE